MFVPYGFRVSPPIIRMAHNTQYVPIDCRINHTHFGCTSAHTPCSHVPRHGARVSDIHTTQNRVNDNANNNTIRYVVWAKPPDHVPSASKPYDEAKNKNRSGSTGPMLTDGAHHASAG